ncbi:MAG: hypothetical protein QOJ90_1251 [Actinomycetota bacterium]|jgi:hypothetical protein|nr:hypothetical protein [Actinomycetota bacterium]
MRRIFPLLLVSVLQTLVLTGVAHADDCNIRDRNCISSQGNQHDGSIVTTGVGFPGLGQGSDLFKATQQSSTCQDCEWSIVPACQQTSPNAADLTCANAAVSCTTPGELRYRVYLRHSGGPWQIQGSVCLASKDRPPTVADVGAAVRARVVNYLPAAHPSFQPRAGGIVNLATVFSAGESRTFTTPAFDVLGFSVVVTGRAHWTWTFDDGVVREFTTPGGRYPDMSVSYTYRGPGDRQVTVTTFWQADYTVNGDGPFPVPGPELSKTAGPITVPVREARSELVGG